MQKYREENDWVEYEPMMNDPSTAYLVDGAELDRQIDELGVTEIGTASGNYNRAVNNTAIQVGSMAGSVRGAVVGPTEPENY